MNENKKPKFENSKLNASIYICVHAYVCTKGQDILRNRKIVDISSWILSNYYHPSVIYLVSLLWLMEGFFKALLPTSTAFCITLPLYTILFLFELNNCEWEIKLSTFEIVISSFITHKEFFSLFVFLNLARNVTN